MDMGAEDLGEIMEIIMNQIKIMEIIK